MELGIDPASVGVLVLLALVDSTSFGTLLIPVWLLLGMERPRVGRISLYLATIALTYLAVGVVLSVGMRLVLDDLLALLRTHPGALLTVAVGVALIWSSIELDRRRKRARVAGTARPGRLGRWRDRVVGAEEGGVGPLLVLAITATVLEFATLLPYLAAIGIITEAAPPPSTHLLLLALYCAVMVLPALVLLALRVIAHEAIGPLLTRLDDWMRRTGGETILWIVLLVGIVLVVNGLDALDGVGGAVDALRELLDGQ